jgi:hypothetical protein
MAVLKLDHVADMVLVVSRPGAVGVMEGHPQIRVGMTGDLHMLPTDAGEFQAGPGTIGVAGSLTGVTFRRAHASRLAWDIPCFSPSE